MELLVLIPALLVFLFFLYKLSGDDHIFIRKNISLEQMFDIAFNTLWISLLISRIFYFLVVPGSNGNFFIAFFTTKGGFSLSGAIAGGIIALYLIGKYKKVPIGRLFDFFTLSFLFALPLGFLGIALLHLKQPILIPYLISALVYLVSAILFKKFLYPKLLNRTLREGNISILFLFLFSFVSFSATFVDFGKKTFSFFTADNVIYLGLFLLGIILYIKQERGRLRRRV